MWKPMMNCYLLSPRQDRQSSSGMFPVTGSSLFGGAVGERAEVPRKVTVPSPPRCTPGTFQVHRPRWASQAGLLTSWVTGASSLSSRFQISKSGQRGQSFTALSAASHRGLIPPTPPASPTPCSGPPSQASEPAAGPWYQFLSMKSDCFRTQRKP